MYSRPVPWAVICLVRVRINDVSGLIFIRHLSPHLSSSFLLRGIPLRILPDMSSKLNLSYIARASLLSKAFHAVSYHVNIWIGRRPYSLSTPPKHFHHSSSLALRQQEYIAASQDPSFRREKHQSRPNSFTLANCIKDQPKLRVIQA